MSKNPYVHPDDDNHMLNRVGYDGYSFDEKDDNYENGLRTQDGSGKHIIIGCFYSQDELARSPYDLSCIDERRFDPGNCTLDEARAWLLKHHPDFYMGSNFSGFVNCKYAAMAIPCSEYGDDGWRTWDDRRSVLRHFADSMNVGLGPIEHDRYGDFIPDKVLLGTSLIYTVDCSSTDRTVMKLSVGSVGKIDDLALYMTKIVSVDGPLDSKYHKGDILSFNAYEIGSLLSDIGADDCRLDYVYDRQLEGSGPAGPSDPGAPGEKDKDEYDGSMSLRTRGLPVRQIAPDPNVYVLQNDDNDGPEFDGF